MSSYFDHFILISITSYINDSLFILLIPITIVGISYLNKSLIPSRPFTIFNILNNHWTHRLKEDGIISNVEPYVHWIQTLFIYLLSLNVLGFMLFTFPVTTHISLTFGIAVSVWLAINLMGIWQFRTKFFSLFMPNGAPLGLAPGLVMIEIASHFSKPIALGMRLAANLTAGHILLAILSDFSHQLIMASYVHVSLFPILIILFMILLELGVIFIQAYVFCLLITIYLKDTVELH